MLSEIQINTMFHEFGLTKYNYLVRIFKKKVLIVIWNIFETGT